MAAQASWAGTLNTNEIFSTLKNLIIGQQVFSKNIGGAFSSLVDRARVDGSLYGDTYLKYSTNILNTYKFEPDTSNQLNLLATNRPEDPKVQAITIDTFRWVPVTIDSYFSKRPFMTETAFADFNSVLLQWLRDTKRVYDATTFNAFVGTCETSEGSQQQTADFGTAYIPAVSTTVDKEAYYRLIAETIAQKLQDIIIDMRDVSDKYNDYDFYRAIDPGDLEIVWNADWVNLIRKVGLPTIFHKDGLLEIKDENILPAKYFGAINSSSTTATAGTRSLVEQTIGGNHYWAGEEIASGATVGAGLSYAQTAAPLNAGSIICKIVHKGDFPYMSGYETETTFINGKNLSENHYLHFGHNTLKHIYEYPLVTVKCAMTAAN